MSLPLLFGTTLSSVPASVPYLAADAELVEPAGALDWAAGSVSRSASPGRAILDYRRDRERSFRLAKLEAIARIPGVQLIGLQGIYGLEQLGEVEGRFAVTSMARQRD